ncbi:MAG: universal stress protein [Methanosarcinaceae archaeon]|nr:universal stress protein [Methanosarcinaceae archaeon]
MSKVYSNIVVATDGTEYVKKAVDYAVDISKMSGAKLHGIYVTDISTISPTSTEWVLVSENLKAESDEALSYIRKKAEESNVEVELVNTEGNPANEVIKYAKNIKADMIVVGAAGKKAVERLLLGSVSEKIVRNSEIPVLVVRLNH